MAKEFTFKGKSVEELQGMSVEEFAKLVSSRERRTLLRYTDKPLLKKVDKALEEKKKGKEPKTIRTHKRDFVVLPKFIGLKFAIYKGNGWEIVDIVPEMLGHVLGEFSMTRKRLRHGKAGIGATKSSTAITARG
ncbi:MAG: 30S ribosomal protein S19 [Candidatus Diapherotrites archaeon]